MKFSFSLLIGVVTASTLCAADAVPWERLNKNDSVLVVLDMQEGLYSLARDFDPTTYHNAMVAHAAIGKLFNLPVVMTSSTQTGPNGPLPQEILEMYPDVSIIQRQGEVDAWDRQEFRDAIQATGRSQIIIGGITTDVCTTFLALSLRAAGYSVWANVEASGTTTELIRDVSNDRMAKAGVQVVSMFSIVSDLMRDWRATPGAAEVIPWLYQYYPAYGMITAAHGYAVENGSLIPGEAQLVSD